MVAIVVSLASTLFAAASPSSSSSFFTKLRSSPNLRLSFASVSPLGSRRGKLMAHTIAQATLGLTLPSSLEPEKVLSFYSFLHSMKALFLFFFPFSFTWRI